MYFLVISSHTDSFHNELRRSHEAPVKKSNVITSSTGTKMPSYSFFKMNANASTSTYAAESSPGNPCDTRTGRIAHAPVLTWVVLISSPP